MPPKLTFHIASVLLLIGMIGGVLLGAVTNAVNGAVSPEYFCEVMAWNSREIPSVWLATVEEGMLEGLACGFGFTLLFVTVTCVLLNGPCHLGKAAKYCVIAFAVSLLFWAVGGACGIAYACIFPNHRDPRFFGYYDSNVSLLRYAWARGSTLGVVVGGLPAVLITSIRFVRSSQPNPIQYSLRSLLVLTVVSAVFFSLAKTFDYPETLVGLAVLLVLIGTVALPPRVHYATGVLLALLSTTLLWAILQQLDSGDPVAHIEWAFVGLASLTAVYVTRTGGRKTQMQSRF